MNNTKTKSDLQDMGFAAAGFFVLRTPMLPFEELMQWSADLQAWGELQSGSDAAAVHSAWNMDVRVLRARLREIVDRPEVRQALFIASPSLESSVENWKRDPDTKKGLQTERSLVRYFSRMCGRSTPFGLFSGCSLGRVAHQGEKAISEMVLAPRSQYLPNSRLDFDYLFALTAGLRRDPKISAELRYWPNTSLRRTGDGWHYVESRFGGTERSHHLVKLYADPILDRVLERAQDGAVIEELVEAVRALADGSEFTTEETRDYVQQLIDSEALVSRLTPQVTGAPALDDLISQLASLPAGRVTAETLGRIRQHMSELDRRGPGIPPLEYRKVAAELDELPAKTDLARLFQVDLIKPFKQGLLSQTFIDDLLLAVELTSRISEHNEPDEIKRFRESFQSRYERAWVPLVQVLDEDVGIGFGSLGDDSAPLLRGLPLWAGQKSGMETSLGSLLQRKIRGFDPERQLELEIDPSELPKNEGAGRTLPDCFDFQVTLAAASMDAVREGNFRIYVGGGLGPPAARLFGRFCHADPELEKHVKNLFRAEEAHDPEAVYAEIVYLPEGRIGNVLSRPVLREHEIVYLGRSGAPLHRQIPASDLLVSVAADGTILLYSQRLNRRVIPRLSNAHGFLNRRLASVYRFLCYLQHQNGVRGPSGLNWGALDSLDFLPRVRVGRVVLKCARWRLTSEDLKTLEKQDRCDCFVTMQTIRRRLYLPRWVQFSESDNTLPVDLDNPLSVDALVHVLKRGQQPILSELYPLSDDLCVTSPEGRFRHEILVPIVRRSHKSETLTESFSLAVQSALAVAPRSVPPLCRQFPPGSNWIYVKLYGGPASLEDVLLKHIPALVGTARGKGLISSWFFVRYADPHQHLRIRFQGPADQLSQNMPVLLSDTFNSLLAAGRIWKIQCDTYQREIERYGGIDGMDLSEEIFFADSEAVLEILKTTEGDDGLEMRWRVALWGVDSLLSDCGLDLEAKLSVMKRLKSHYQRQFQAGVETWKAIGDRFRRERPQLEALFRTPHPQNEILRVAAQVLANRSTIIRATVQQLSALADHGKLAVSIPDLAETYVHMHVNRMFRSSQNAHELILYDFLFRLYDSQLAQRDRSSRAGLSAQ